ncbi:hypothetical protein GpartN1_g742.t1 [Galdieria partita]|uniref:Uncharacterized protein n=1 Tax=Galdieria partita TaxID=83374 RepID=A0A9C7UN20_9RHOD|nr:hypothetical protein GpartN1_g742.t1 [Galdieria partita]
MASSYKRFMSIQQKKQVQSAPKPSRRHSNPENHSSSTKDTPPAKGNITDASANTVGDRFSTSSQKGSYENDYVRSNMFQHQNKKDSLSKNSSYSGSRSSQNPEITDSVKKPEEYKLLSTYAPQKLSAASYTDKTSSPSTVLLENYSSNGTVDRAKDKTLETLFPRINDVPQNEINNEVRNTEECVLTEKILNRNDLQSLILEYKANTAVSPRPRTRSFIDTSTDLTSKSSILDTSRSFSVDTRGAEESHVLCLKASSRHTSTHGSTNAQNSSDDQHGANCKKLIELAKKYLAKEYNTTSRELFRIAATSSDADDEERILFVQNGFVPKLVEIFDREYNGSEGMNVVEKVHIASIAGNLALTDTNEEAIATSGLLERFILVIKALSPYSSLDHLTLNFLQECCRAIRNLSENTTTMSMILHSETINSFPVLVANVYKQSHSCVTEAIAAMRNLCRSEECRSQLVESNGVTIVCDILNETDISSTTKFSPELVSQICSFLAEIVIDNRAAKQLVSYESVFLLLLRNMSSAIPEVAFESVRAVANCFASEGAQKKFSQGNIVEQVIPRLEESIASVFGPFNDKQEIDISLRIAVAIEASRALANLALGVIHQVYPRVISVAKTCAEIILNEDEENFPAPIIHVLFELRGECLRCVANLSEDSTVCIELAKYLLSHANQNVLNMFLRKCIQYCGETFREDAARLISNLLEIPSLESESSVLCRLGSVLSEVNGENDCNPDHSTSSLLIPFLNSFTLDAKVDNKLHNREVSRTNNTNFTSRFPRNCMGRDYNITGPLETFVEELHRLKEFCKKLEKALQKGLLRQEVSIESLASAFEQVCATRECLGALLNSSSCS